MHKSIWSRTILEPFRTTSKSIQLRYHYRTTSKSYKQLRYHFPKVTNNYPTQTSYKQLSNSDKLQTTIQLRQVTNIITLENCTIIKYPTQKSTLKETRATLELQTLCKLVLKNRTTHPTLELQTLCKLVLKNRTTHPTLELQTTHEPSYVKWIPLSENIKSNHHLRMPGSYTTLKHLYWLIL